MGNALTWTMGRQLASFGSNTYTYNEDGIRTSKTANNVRTTFLLDGYNVIEQTGGTTTLHFFYDSNGEIIGFRYDGNDYFYVRNAMSDIIAITDSNKNIVAEYRYDPWGKVLDEENLTAIGNLNPFRYRSYYYDSDIKMYYLQSRYYDAEVGRFINCDDVNYIGLTGTVGSYNAFAYCENNPVNCVDALGCGPILIATLIGLSIGGLLGAGASYLYHGRVKISWVAGGAIIGAFIGATGTWAYTTFKGVAKSWLAYKAAQFSAGASAASASIGRMFEQWYYNYNKIGKAFQQITYKLSNGSKVRLDAIFKGRIIELKNYDWSKYKSYTSLINSFKTQATKYQEIVGKIVCNQKIKGITFYFSSKPPQQIIDALNKIGVKVKWVK